MSYFHPENHRNSRVAWLRASVLGANDGIISVACLLVGMAAGGATPGAMALAAVAGVLAGALSMAAGEYVSVQSQADLEAADIAKETRELAEEPERELLELKGIYKGRGLPSELALQVAQALTAHNALEAHLRDELGIVEQQRARPLLAAMASAASFFVGAAVPCVPLVLFSGQALLLGVAGLSLASLLGLGALAAHLGGAPVARAALRVFGWGGLAMLVTALAGHFLGGALV
jgi:vacuolar iron transporter family protein